MNDVVTLVNEMLQTEQSLTYRAMLARVHKICLPNTKRHEMCFAGCVAFPPGRGQRDSKCPKCGEYRYDQDNGVPRRVFHHIPLRDLVSRHLHGLCLLSLCFGLHTSACVPQVDATFCRSNLVRALLRTPEGGLPFNEDPVKPWSDITESLGWNNVVHHDDPTFGTSYRNLVIQVAADGAVVTGGHSAWFIMGMIMNLPPSIRSLCTQPPGRERER
jgi:hypothetical protein